MIMVETVVLSALPVDELLSIRKNRLEPDHQSGSEKRICIVTGTHGDELEGQYVCYEVNRRIQSQMENLKGIVDIYPAFNPLVVEMGVGMRITKAYCEQLVDGIVFFAHNEPLVLENTVVFKVIRRLHK